uniref:glutaminyl-peptide cyclotransferase n=1 Tax=Alistipes sp. TaxID=1872444 RepID=UPI00405684E8
MNRLKQLKITTLVVASLLVACGGTKGNKAEDKAEVAASPAERYTPAALYNFRVVKEYPHSVESYTQGLQYVDGVMWEGTGQEGRSHLQRVDLGSGKVDIVASLPDDEFGEGITHFDGCIYQLTWLSHLAHVYDREGRELRTVKYRGEGWGITTNGRDLYLSDGTSTIRRVDPETFDTLESICVTFDGAPLDLINELEWVDGSIWANVYLTDAIVEIDPKTGVVVGYVDLPELRQRLEANPEAEAFNGVAYDPATKHFYVTGKQWNKLFEIEIIK